MTHCPTCGQPPRQEHTKIVEGFVDILKEGIEKGYLQAPASNLEVWEVSRMLMDVVFPRSAEPPHLSDNSEPNVELFRGDPTDYPEHLREIALCLRDVWRFSLPQKPRKKEKKGQYAFWIMSMDDLKQACGEHGTKVLEVLHKEYVEYAKSHGGTWPHSVAGPQSLVNVARGRAAQMRTITFVVKEKQKTGLEEFLDAHGNNSTSNPA